MGNRKARPPTKIYSSVARRASEIFAADWHGRCNLHRMYSGAGRSLISVTNQIIDGSAVAAFKAGQASGHPFSEMHLSDVEAANSAALAQRIKTLGGTPTSYDGDATVVVD
jgi:hypothetical protein